MRQLSYPCSCYICHKTTTSLGIATHFMRSHGTDDQKGIFKQSAITLRCKKSSAEKKYYLLPNLCKVCDKVIPYLDRKNSYCSRSCSAKVNNQKRAESGWAMTEKSKLKIRNTLKETRTKNGIIYIPAPEKTDEVTFSKLNFCKCKFCTNTFTAPRPIKVCQACEHLKYQTEKDKYSFKFNVYKFPELFDLTLLKEVGWCSFGGKRGGAKNLNGLSRDHKVSVNEAKRNNYDPYYISHPCNCELIPMSENNKKKTSSSITYAELIQQVKEYDKNILG